MGFVASKEVEALTYDFRPHVDLHGTIPEPTTEQVETYRDVFFNAVKDLAPDLMTEADEDDWIVKVDTLLAKSKEVEDEATRATADLTGIPEETLQALPFRIRSAFVGWIMGVFVSPEA